MEERKKYFKGLTRRDYIAKANEIIHREGIEAVTIRRIAKEMGCSTASLYRYFDSRDELLYYAELGEMNDYIRRLNAAEKHWRNVWDIYVGVWYCYSMEAFRKPEAYNLLFFANNNTKLRVSIREYYQMFPENLELSNRVFHEMLQTADFMGRDLKCAENVSVPMPLGMKMRYLSIGWSVFCSKDILKQSAMMESKKRK